MIKFDFNNIIESIDLDIPEKDLEEEIFDLFFEGIDCIRTMLKDSLTITELVKMFLIVFNETKKKKYIYFSKRRLFSSTETAIIANAEYNILSDEESNNGEIGALVSGNYLEMIFTMEFIELLCTIEEDK